MLLKNVQHPTVSFDGSGSSWLCAKSLDDLSWSPAQERCIPQMTGVFLHASFFHEKLVYPSLNYGGVCGKLIVIVIDFCTRKVPFSFR